MIAVYPYKRDAHDGLELRYSIRSLCRFFRPLTDIIVVGDIPWWYKGKHIPYRDNSHKERNIYNKLNQVQDTVLFMNDDYYFLKPVEHMPFYYKGVVTDRYNAPSYYRDMYKRCPNTWKDFDGHWPMVVDTRQFEWLGDMPIKTQYCNQNYIEGTLCSDLKFFGSPTEQEVRQAIEGRLFFSSYNNAHKGGLNIVMQELFNKKSEYEA